MLASLRICAILILLPGFLFLPSTAPAGNSTKIKHKDDSIVLDNGDHITGEVKKMEHGMLYFKSDRTIGTLQFDWLRIRRIHSRGRYEFELDSGIRLIGIIAEDPENKNADGALVLNLSSGDSVSIKLGNILGIREMDRSFLSRVNLSLNAGVTFTQANHNTQFTFQGSIGFVKPNYSLSINANSLFSTQEGAQDINRHELFTSVKRNISTKWSYLGLVDLLHDSELALELRSTVGGGLQRSLVKTNRVDFFVFGGAAYSRENYVGSAQDRSNGEFLGGLGLTAYQFRSSEIGAYVIVYPSFTDFGRVRIDTSDYWKWELIKDLYWNVSLFDNYDNNPVPGAPNNNFGVTTSLGWTF
ncbi:MAG TPA: DUF481 domain-containing protein [Acidobacteriota bacterium]|nr:DUF481 domain-containing protein [Acidobacteriota bacterium]